MEAINFFPAIRKPNYIALAVITLIYFLIAAFILKDYFIIDMHFIAGLIVFPFVINIREGSQSFRYFLPALILLGSSFKVNLSTLYYIALTFSILLAIETLIGKTNYPLLCLFALLSPAFKYVTVAFGFPIRLMLSKYAGKFIHLLGYETEVLGNLIIVNNQEFSVDPACMGLKMLFISILISILFISYFEKKYATHTSFLKSTFIILMAIILNILCNLIRIIFLVIFNIPQDNTMHDVTGIICLLIYTILPCYFITYLLLRNAKPETSNNQISYQNVWRAFNICIMLGFITLAFYSGASQTITTTPPELNLKLEGFKKENYKSDIVKFENEEVLIYVKAISNFYSADHNPMICWTGSGYEFHQIKQSRLGKFQVYTGTLQIKNDTIYSIWWFDNGKIKTIDQLDWRWTFLNDNSPFYLINVNALSEEKVKEEALKLLTQQL